MLFLLKDILTVLYLRKNVLYPVKKINEFARLISKGNLDIPVGRVDCSFLGEFSESFDMMREDLVYAKYQFFTIDSKELQQEFQTIIEKANQINGLVINLHTSTMNDLEKLEVNPEAVESSKIEKALRQADFKKGKETTGRVVTNSYKYADTEIEVRSYFEDNYLCVCIKDFGNGVKKEEEVFLTQKYFRGNNAKEKEGSGMGLYIRHLRNFLF